MEVRHMKTNENEELDIIDVLLDEENREPIVLTDSDGNKLSFEQIAVIPYDDKIYCVLKPIDKLKGIGDDEAIVFYVDEESGEEPVLMVERYELKAISVFEKYYDMLENDN
jgi:uncharacterized protein YrzB (UPF0473 family)